MSRRVSLCCGQSTYTQHVISPLCTPIAVQSSLSYISNRVFPYNFLCFRYSHNRTHRTRTQAPTHTQTHTHTHTHTRIRIHIPIHIGIRIHRICLAICAVRFISFSQQFKISFRLSSLIHYSFQRFYSILICALLFIILFALWHTKTTRKHTQTQKHTYT